MVSFFEKLCKLFLFIKFFGFKFAVKLKNGNERESAE